MTSAELLQLIKCASVPVPVSELILLLGSLSLCMLFRLPRLGLIFAYICTLHMGWLFCERELLSHPGQSGPFVAIYFFFGGLILFLAIITMLRSTD